MGGTGDREEGGRAWGGQVGRDKGGRVSLVSERTGPCPT